MFCFASAVNSDNNHHICVFLNAVLCINWEGTDGLKAGYQNKWAVSCIIINIHRCLGQSGNSRHQILNRNNPTSLLSRPSCRKASKICLRKGLLDTPKVPWQKRRTSLHQVEKWSVVLAYRVFPHFNSLVMYGVSPRKTSSMKCATWKHIHFHMFAWTKLML